MNVHDVSHPRGRKVEATRAQTLGPLETTRTSTWMP